MKPTKSELQKDLRRYKEILKQAFLRQEQRYFFQSGVKNINKQLKNGDYV